ncbi:SDR family oxidoreductase [Alkalibacter rhizosphaerae]|uniref:SDR family oxidoreductase n=1 Tax=Alkalibacter rhizosphaerae TaxID=2815577 RepID=A0A974XIV1_9FIRM|nr:SDR family oxidoreductase [Alkalibacter rhizosphaerae]QSX09515.1 SDR family oxidoreductase [Alkalibacter rhizosphaerae]
MEKLYVYDEKYEKTRGMDLKIAQSNVPFADMLSLEGKSVIVTGGSRGLGFHVVNRLCEAGAEVMIVDIAKEFAQDALEYFAGKGYQVQYKEADIRSVDQINEAVEAAIEAFGKIDILVNNAAVWSMKRFLDMTEETWDATIDTDLKGNYFFCQAVAKEMVKQNIRGKIVNVASVAGLSMESPYGFLSHYSSAKGGLVSVSQSLARELKPLGITINCVLPGGMVTPGALHTEGMDASMYEIHQKSPKTPATRNPDEVARVVFMMCTDVSAFMHGSTIVADGGARLMIQE